MSLPPALLQRLAQRGLVQKPKSKTTESTAAAAAAAAENEEVIAEDYDEMDTDDVRNQEEYQYPSMYETETARKRIEENFWLERIKTRMGEAGSTVGYRGCPNKYNIWHKCTLYCVNRWAEGKPEPSREYMRRFRRLLRKYPLPKGWSEMYDPGCGCYYFLSLTDNLVSWLPPTHPKSQVTKSAAAFRRQMEDSANGENNGGGGSDGEQHTDDADELEDNEEARHHREIEDIINAAMGPRTPTVATAAAHDHHTESVTTSTAAPQRKQKSRDLDRTIARQRREREKERERERDRGRGRHARGDTDPVDPMDPSAYSDIPRGKWSDGLNTGVEERKKSGQGNSSDDVVKERSSKRSDKRDKHSSDDEDKADNYE